MVMDEGCFARIAFTNKAHFVGRHGIHLGVDCSLQEVMLWLWGFLLSFLCSLQCKI
jgi:hypothetical protein